MQGLHLLPLHKTPATPHSLSLSSSPLTFSLAGVWKQSSSSTYHQQPWNPQLEHKDMFYILMSVHVTTLKPQHPVPELFRSYPALSVTSDCECNGQYIRGAGGRRGCFPLGIGLVFKDKILSTCYSKYHVTHVYCKVKLKGRFSVLFIWLSYFEFGF